MIAARPVTRRAARGLALAAVLIANASTAAGAPGATALAQLDADAALVIAVRPTELRRTLNAMTALPAPPGPLRALAGALERAAGRLGAELDDEAGWRQFGLAGGTPIVGSIAAIDAIAARRVFDALAEAATWDDRRLRKIRKTYWRSRLVLTVANRRRAARTVRRAALETTTLEPVELARAAAIATLLGARGGAAAPATVRQLRRAGVLAIGPIDGLPGLVSIRLHHRKDLLVVDLLVPFAGVPIVWRRDSRAMLARITRHDRRRKPPAGLTPEPQAQLLGASLGVWLRPAGALAAARAASLHAGLARAAGIDPAQARAAALLATAARLAHCDALEPLATRGPLTDAIARIEPSPGGLRVELRWRVRRDHGLIAALRPRPRALFAPAEVDAQATAVWLGELAPLAALPPNPALHGGTAAWREAAARCGAGASVAVLLGWPELAVAELAAVRGRGAGVAAAIDAATGAAVALPRAGEADARSPVAAVAVASARAGAIADALDDDFGARDDDDLGHRWPLEGGAIAFARKLSDAAVAVGRAGDDADLGWFLATGEPDEPDERKPPTALLGAFRLELAGIAGMGGPDAGSGEIAGTLRLGRRTLVAELEIRPAPR